jgi:NAD(P)-dependent dehydrogenase (short-subunit alcohol dehydrogenase family)
MGENGASKPFHGRRYLITGASGRLGQAVARRLAAGGASLVLVARGGEGLARVRAQLPDATPVIARPLNVADWNSVSELAAAVHVAGALDGLVHASGQFAAGALADQAPLVMGDIINTAVLGALWLTRAFTPVMASRGQGRVVLVSAEAAAPGRGADPLGTSVAYLTAKAGVASLGRALARELRGSGVGVSVVYPSTFDDAPGPGVLATDAVAEAVLSLLDPSRPAVTELVLAGA